MDNFPHPPTMLLIAAAVLTLVFLLNRYLFRPLTAILDKRREETESARREFDEARRIQEERIAEIEARLESARREAFEIRESAQKDARAARSNLLAEARAEAGAELEKAKEQIRAQVEEAKKGLATDAESLARQAAERLLRRPVGPGTEES